MKLRTNEQQKLEELFQNEDDLMSEAIIPRAEIKQKIRQVQVDMAHMISHKFRTPLSILLSSAELLEYYSNSLDEERRLEHLCRIRAAVLDLTQMLDQILVLYGQSNGAERHEENSHH